ncbi:MAG TPA: HD domain-containing protein [Acidimicrobiales bacterium]|nr:HD domain-containing protein [Acidimicrobiales bacterium]
MRPRHIAHLGRRFMGSLWPGGPSRRREGWVATVLSPAEHRLWRRMSGPDRRHAVAVARRVDRAMGGGADRPVLVAALLHDVGKVEAGLGLLGRVAATAASLAGRRPGGAMGAYLRHAEVGSGLLEEAGSDPVTVAWAREHHLPPDRWTVPAEIGAVLKACDDD